MSDDFYTRLIHEVAELRRQVANMLTPASIKEVKGDKVRMIIGKDSDGKDVLGPWQAIGDRRGGTRIRNLYKPGQNVWLFSPSGDPAQSVVLPGAPNKNFMAPDHATDDDPEGGSSSGSGSGGGGQQGQSGQQSQQTDEETYQQAHFRKKFTPNGGVWFRQEPQKKQQEQQKSQSNDWENGTNSEMPKRQKQKPDGEQSVRMHKDDGVELRHGKGDAKVNAHPKGSRLRKKGVYIVVEDSRGLLQGAIYYFDRPPRIKKIADPVPTEDKTDV